MASLIQNHALNLRSRHSPQGPILIENKFSIISRMKSAIDGLARRHIHPNK